MNTRYSDKTERTDEQLTRARLSEELFFMHLLFHARMTDPVKAAEGIPYADRHSALVERLVQKDMIYRRQVDGQKRAFLSGAGYNNIAKMCEDYQFFTGDIDNGRGNSL